jgi:OmpA family
MAIGGMARTQYALVDRKTGGWWKENQRRSFVDWLAEDAKSDLAELSDELSGTVRIEFEPRSDTLAQAETRRLQKTLAGFATENLRVVGYADRFQDFASDAENDALSNQRAQAVAKALQRGLAARRTTRRKPARRPSEDDYTIRVMPGGARGTRPVEERTPPGAHYRYAVVGIDRDLLPGEHGFRFFPSYYRHVFDTMQRIPLLNAAGDPTGRTVYNNIVPSTFQGLSAGGANPFLFPRVRTDSAIAALDQAKNLEALGYSPADLQQFVGRILQFLTSCTLRRQQEYEEVSWWDFLMGKSRADRLPVCRYTKAFADDVKDSGRVLAAFDSIWGDARTCGDTFIQLLLNNVSNLPKTDGTLCGPTTEAWLAPWRRYLETLGVQFEQAELLGFEQEAGGGLVVRERRFDHHTNAWEARERRLGPKDKGYPQYFIVALDAPAAAKATDALKPFGVLENLRKFVHVVPGNPDDRRPEFRKDLKRDPCTRPGERPWDRFQTLSGVQYFFTADFCLSEGYMYYEDSDWSLSSVNSQHLWRRRPRYNTDGYISLMSVDIGSFLKPSQQSQRSAWNSSRSEIARETWRQIQASLIGFAPLTRDRRYYLPQPTYYHLDENLRFAEGRIIRNDTPYLIPVRGDWHRRPAADPWDPTPRAGDTRPALEPLTPPNHPDDVWQAPHGGYLVHWRCLVFAGVYMKTFTRMTTMEAANESARHAVNAVLDHYYDKLKGPAGGAPPDPAEGLGVGPRQGRHVGTPTDFGCEELFHPLPIGDYCRIWDPEKNELDWAIPLRILDEDLFAKGLPHLLDPAWAAVLAADPIGTPVQLAEITGRLLTQELRERQRLLWSYVAPWLSPAHEFASGTADAWQRLWNPFGSADPLQRVRDFLEVLRQIRADLERQKTRPDGDPR